MDIEIDAIVRDINMNVSYQLLQYNLNMVLKVAQLSRTISKFYKY